MTALSFAPVLPWPVLAGLAAVLAAFLGVALARRALARGLRALAGLVLLGALAGVLVQSEIRAGLSDIVLVLVDRSASQGLADRAQQTETALKDLTRQLGALPNTEIRLVEVGDGAKNAGTELGAALERALAREPKGRVAGVFVLSDGRAHDAGAWITPAPAPVHLLLTGRARDWDRRLVITNAPAFGIIGETLTLGLRVEDQGAAPEAAEAEVSVSVDGAEPITATVPLGVDMELPIALSHGGQNVVQIAVAQAEGELSARNNAASVQINGLRDRLSVLLVSGEPHAGERTWRNLLKSDAGIDLVHFTILRSPDKQDDTPLEELALIAFPTQELFEEKIDKFDLIIFDRYAQRGILPPEYFDNIRRFVEGGGALLVAAGPEYAGAESLYYSPLSAILPAQPTGIVREAPFLPRPTEQGLRHPVIAGLERMPPVSGAAEGPVWGRWLRQVELKDPVGETVLAGEGGAPLLLLNRVGEGRVALLASDQAWLWDRGYDGGGPQLELLKRIAHWTMREPELEEEALYAEVIAGEGKFRIIRRSMAREVGEVTITAPDGTTRQIALGESAEGRFTAEIAAPQTGLYRLTQGEFSRVVAMGPASPREFEETIASAQPLAEQIRAAQGRVYRLEAGMPDIRALTSGVYGGESWAAITPRGASSVSEITRRPLAPDWLWLTLALGLMLAAWLFEGRRRD